MCANIRMTCILMLPAPMPMHFDQIGFGYSLDILVYFCCWTYLTEIKTIKKLFPMVQGNQDQGIDTMSVEDFSLFLRWYTLPKAEGQEGLCSRTIPHSVELCPNYIITPKHALTIITLVIKFQMNFRTQIITLSWGNFKNSQSSTNMQ